MMSAKNVRAVLALDFCNLHHGVIVDDDLRIDGPHKLFWSTIRLGTKPFDGPQYFPSSSQHTHPCWYCLCHVFQASASTTNSFHTRLWFFDDGAINTSAQQQCGAQLSSSLDFYDFRGAKIPAAAQKEPLLCQINICTICSQWSLSTFE